MEDFIERSKAIGVLNKLAKDNFTVRDVFSFYIGALLDAADGIKQLPSVDAVEVVRCKDCKYQDKGENESESWNVCNYRPWLYFSIDDDDYCSYGEREDG